MRLLSICALFAVALLLAQPAGAQQCPAGLADPLQLIDGQTWVFQTGAADYLPFGMASIGTFTARYAPAGAGVTNTLPMGYLTVKETVNGVPLAGSALGLTRLAGITGKYQIYPDCSGGTLSVNLNQQAMQWDFVFANGYTEMYLTTQSLVNNESLARSYAGIATLSNAPACPVGVDPVQLLAGAVWSFRSQSAAYRGSGSSHVGTLKPTVSPAGAGVLSSVETVSYNGYPSSARLESGAGRFQVYPDCSGGILIMTGLQPVTYEFLFTNNAFNQILLLSDTLRYGPNTNDALMGSARKY